MADFRPTPSAGRRRRRSHLRRNAGRRWKPALKQYVVDRNRRLARLLGAEFSVESSSPEWENKAESRLSALIQRIYEKRFGKKLAVEVSHGGNECGAFFKAFPDADIVCTGTQIIGAHTPDESVLVSIVQKEWEMLCLTLKGILEY